MIVGVETQKKYHIWPANIGRENVESIVEGDLCRCLNTTARATLVSWLFFTTCQGRPRFRCNIICILVLVLATVFHIFNVCLMSIKPPLHFDYVTGPWQKHYWKEWLSIYMQCPFIICKPQNNCKSKRSVCIKHKELDQALLVMSDPVHWKDW